MTTGGCRDEGTSLPVLFSFVVGTVNTRRTRSGITTTVCSAGRSSHLVIPPEHSTRATVPRTSTAGSAQGASRISRIASTGRCDRRLANPPLQSDGASRRRWTAISLDRKAMPWWEMKLSGRIWVMALWCSVSLAVLGCSGSGSGSSATDCPSYVVVPDGGASGFSSVGEWRTDAVCAQYCHADYPVCQLATPTSVKCQKGCA